ncbi:hypothetical protein C8Q74DRAFT_904869 [Fomes fomentarius]|nr:hypothetical protein C8Q74DRAFT_904869 [Fomes fomentarius]
MMGETRGKLHVWPSGRSHREDVVGDLQRGTSNSSPRHEGRNEAAPAHPPTPSRPNPAHKRSRSPSSPLARSNIPSISYRLSQSLPPPIRSSPVQRPSLHSITPFLFVPDKSPFLGPRLLLPRGLPGEPTAFVNHCMWS